MYRIFLILVFCLSAINLSAHDVAVTDEKAWDAPQTYLEWSVAEALPAAVARPFHGVIDNDFYVMGGSMFDKAPTLGGKKSYTDRIFRITKDGAAMRVVELHEKLPLPLAEGTTIRVKDGLLLIGGANENGTHADVWKMTIVDSRPTFTAMPAFPIPVTMGVGGVIPDQSQTPAVEIPYVFANNTLYAFDADSWIALPGIPDAPMRSQACGAVRTADHGKTALFIFGGYDLDSSAHPALYDAWQAVPTRRTESPFDLQVEWKRSQDIRVAFGDTETEVCTIGAMALPLGAQTIIVVGGFNGRIWDAAQTDPNRHTDAWRAAYYARSPEEFKWNKPILAFHTVIGEWTTMPVELPTPTCGAAVGLLGKTLVVAGGELKPAERMSWIQSVDLDTPRNFGFWNWVVFLVYLGLMLPFGFFFMRRNSNTEDYFKGGGRLPWWVTGVSIFATMLSSITFMTVPAMTFNNDWRFFPLSFSIFLLAPVVIYFYLPFFRRLNVTSAYEYLERRFNTFSRLFASTAFIVFMVVRSAIVVYLPSLALSIVAGVDIFVSIALVGAVTVIYSTIGGCEAVVWSDFIQAIVLIGGAITAIILLIMGTDGGTMGMIDVAVDNSKLYLFDLGWDIAEPVLWVTLIGGIASNLSSYTSDQTIVQRYLTTKDEKTAGRSIWFNGILSIVSSAFFYLIGTALYSYYKSNPGVFDFNLYQNDGIFPTYIVSQMPPGISGLLIAAIFAATMSTLSSNFNSAATAFVTDFYRRFINDNEQRAFKVAHHSTAVVGILATGAALVIATIDISSLFMEFQKVIGILTGGLAGLFLMGIFIPRINGIGAVAGLVASYVANLVLIYSALIPHKPHFLLYGAVALIACVVTGYIVSLVTGRPSADKLRGYTLATMLGKEEQN